MKAYKIRMDAYKYDIDTQEEGVEKKTKTICVKWELPRILCNPNLTKKGDGKPDPDFDLMEIGPIAQKIGQCEEMFVTVNEQELKILKDRIKEVSHFFGFNQYEMFRRVIESQPVDMVEKK